MGYKKDTEDRETSPKFNTGLGFALRLNAIMDMMTDARLNKEGSKWVDYLLAAYQEGMSSFDEPEKEKMNNYMNTALQEVERLNRNQNQSKKLKITGELYKVCWDFEAYLRECLTRHDLMNINEIKFEKDSY